MIAGRFARCWHAPRWTRWRHTRPAVSLTDTAVADFQTQPLPRRLRSAADHLSVTPLPLPLHLLYSLRALCHCYLTRFLWYIAAWVQFHCGIPFFTVTEGPQVVLSLLTRRVRSEGSQVSGNKHTGEDFNFRFKVRAAKKNDTHCVAAEVYF